jgi:hypothetical protein
MTSSIVVGDMHCHLDRHNLFFSIPPLASQLLIKNASNPKTLRRTFGVSQHTNPDKSIQQTSRNQPLHFLDFFLFLRFFFTSPSPFFSKPSSPSSSFA